MEGYAQLIGVNGMGCGSSSSVTNIAGCGSSGEYEGRSNK